MKNLIPVSLINEQKYNGSLLKDVKIIFSNHMIQEDIHRSNTFLGIIEYFKNINLFQKISLFKMINLLPLMFKNINIKKLRKRKGIYLYKFSFSKDAYKDFISCIDRSNFENLEYDEINEFYKNFIEKYQNKVAGIYVPFCDSIGIMILNNDVYDEDTIKHEMIHYFQDVTGHSLIKNSKIKIDETFKTYGLIDNDSIKMIFNSREIIPYIHNVCYVFENNGIKNWDQAKEILNKFLKDWIPENDEFIFKYIEQCKNLKQYQWFKNKIASVHMLMLCAIYHQHINTIKNYVASYFNSKLIQKNEEFFEERS